MNYCYNLSTGFNCSRTHKQRSRIKGLIRSNPPHPSPAAEAQEDPAGTALIQTLKITIEPGMKTGPHKHAIPLLA